MKTEIKWYVHQRRGALPVSDIGNALAKPDRNIQKINHHGHILVETEKGKTEADSDYINVN